MAKTHFANLFEASRPDFFPVVLNSSVRLGLRVSYLTEEVVCFVGDITMAGHMRTVLNLFFVFETDCDVIALWIRYIFAID